MFLLLLQITLISLLTRLVEQIYQFFEKNKFTVRVFDLSTASDTVDHQILPKKQNIIVLLGII